MQLRWTKRTERIEAAKEKARKRDACLSCDGLGTVTKYVEGPKLGVVECQVCKGTGRKPCR